MAFAMRGRARDAARETLARYPAPVYRVAVRRILSHRAVLQRDHPQEPPEYNVSRTSRIIAAVALAAAVGMGAPSPAAAQDAPPEVTYRKNLMQLIRTNLNQIRAMADVNQAGHTVHYARALYGNGEMLADAFRNGSAANSGSLPVIWQNQAGFAERVRAFETATARLLEAAEMRDQAAIQTAVQAVGQTCGACHQTFRVPTN
jgi:cytochrome c556